MLDKWLNPIPIVREYVASKMSTRRVARKKTFKEKVHDLQHKNLNKEKDGRINCGFDEDGKILAHSVSPYSKEFFSAIEPKIKPLMSALRNKLYLTTSSCQSHCLYSRRYVTLAFWSHKCADNFVYEISRLVPGIIFKKFKAESYMNMVMEWDENGNFKGLKRGNATKEAATRSLNMMFDRNYEEYIIVEMIIAEEITNKDTWFSSLKKKLFKIFFMEKRTKQLVDAILSDDVSWYGM